MGRFAALATSRSPPSAMPHFRRLPPTIRLYR